MSAVTIEKIDPQDAATRQRVWEFLAPSESRAMFILGNLRGNTPSTHMYAASRGGHWLGVAAYYERYKSIVPFSLEPGVVRTLTRHLAEHHPLIEWLNGWQDIAGPALEELLLLGYESCRDPRQVFMELDGLPPDQPWEHACRLIAPDDALAVARVLRHLQQIDPDAPITAEDIAKVRGNPQRYVAEHDGAIVSTAATSGLAITACQIIGVATDPGFRRRGFARSVCAALIRHMAAKGASRTVLFTDVNNVTAQRCYQGLGFRITAPYCLAQFKLPAH